MGQLEVDLCVGIGIVELSTQHVPSTQLPRVSQLDVGVGLWDVGTELRRHNDN